jgi:hypothetical protein
MIRVVSALSLAAQWQLVFAAGKAYFCTDKKKTSFNFALADEEPITMVRLFILVRKIWVPMRL